MIYKFEIKTPSSLIQFKDHERTKQKLSKPKQNLSIYNYYHRKKGEERNTLSILSSTTKTRDKLSQEAIFIYIDRFNNNNYKFCCL